MTSTSESFVYILRCRDNSFYVGHAADVPARVLVLNEGRGARWTTKRRPVLLVYQDSRPNLLLP